LSEIDGLARAGGAADNTGLSISLKSGGIPTADVPQWRIALARTPRDQKDRIGRDPMPQRA